MSRDTVAHVARTEDETDREWSERRFRTLAEATATEVFHNAPDGRLLSDLPQWRRLTGQTREQLEGFGWLDAVHPEDMPLVEAAWRGAVQAGTVFDAEYRISRADDVEGWAHVWVRSAPLRDDQGEVVEYIGLYHDVTERVRRTAQARDLEVALDRETSIVEQVVQEAPVGLALFWGPDHRYRLVNPAYEVTVPERGDSLVGRAVGEVFPETADVIPLLDRVRGGEQAPSTEIRVPFGGAEAVDGLRHYRVSLSPIPEPDGAPGGILAMVVEITEDVRARRDLERELERERQVAEELQRAMLPDALPDIPGFEFCARYEPAGEGSFVGGDWYDVFDVGDGRVAVAVGDVAGRGLKAATVMGQLRSALRAYAIDDPMPGAVLARMDELVDRLGGSATLAYGLITRHDGQLLQGLAGHPPPLLVAGGDGARWLDEGRGTPLGAPSASRTTAEIVVPDGGVVLYYTDGLLQERELGIGSGLEQLRAAAAGVEGLALGTVCERLVDADVGRDDDRALLAVRRAA